MLKAQHKNVMYTFEESNAKPDGDCALHVLGESREGFIKVLTDAKLDEQDEDALSIEVEHLFRTQKSALRGVDWSIDEWDKLIKAEESIDEELQKSAETFAKILPDVKLADEILNQRIKTEEVSK